MPAPTATPTATPPTIGAAATTNPLIAEPAAAPSAVAPDATALTPDETVAMPEPTALIPEATVAPTGANIVPAVMDPIPAAAPPKDDDIEFNDDVNELTALLLALEMDDPNEFKPAEDRAAPVPTPAVAPIVPVIAL